MKWRKSCWFFLRQNKAALHPSQIPLYFIPGQTRNPPTEENENTVLDWIASEICLDLRVPTFPGLILTESNPCGFLVGGNFYAGYDLKELAHSSTLFKLEQDVTSGLALIVGT